MRACNYYALLFFCGILTHFPIHSFSWDCEKFDFMSKDVQCAAANTSFVDFVKKDFRSNYYVYSDIVEDCAEGFKDIYIRGRRNCVKVKKKFSIKENLKCIKLPQSIEEISEPVYNALFEHVLDFHSKSEPLSSIEMYDFETRIYSRLLLKNVDINYYDKVINEKYICFDKPLLAHTQTCLQSNYSAFEYQPYYPDVPKLQILLDIVRLGLTNQPNICYTDGDSLNLSKRIIINHGEQKFVSSSNSVIKVRVLSENRENKTKVKVDFDESSHQLSFIINEDSEGGARPVDNLPYGMKCYDSSNNSLEARTTEDRSKVFKSTYSIQYAASVDLKYVNAKYPRIYNCNVLTISGQILLPFVIEFAGLDKPVFSIVMDVLEHVDLDYLLVNVLSGCRGIETYKLHNDGESDVMQHYLHIEMNKLDLSLNSSGEKKGVYDIMNNLTLQLNSTRHSKLRSIRSASYCFAELLPKLSKSNWQSVRIGQRSSTDEECLTGNSLPYTVLCAGDAVEGGYWSEIPEGSRECLDQTKISNFTSDLFQLKRDLLSNKDTAINVFNKLYETLMSIDVDIIKPVDIIQIGQIFELLEFNNKQWDSFANHGLKVVQLVDVISRVNRSVINAAADVSLNTTNIILHSLDMSLNKPFSCDVNGLNVIRTANLIVTSINPTIRNITGIALYLKPGEFMGDTDSLDNYELEYVYMNQSLDELLEDNEHLDLATFIPINLYEYFVQRQGSISRMIMTVFLNDKLFRTVNRSLTSVRKVISVIIPDHDRYFPFLLPTVYYADNEDTPNELCRYYNYKPLGSDSILGSWDTMGCHLIEHSSSAKLTACGCTHLTHFTFLLMGQQLMYTTSDIDDAMRHNSILEWIARVCSGLSLFGIFTIVLTAIAFRSWRSDKRNQFILHFAIAIGLQILLIVIADVTVNTEKTLCQCVALGSSLQYIILVTFSWMLMLALRQYARFVTVFNSDITMTFFVLAVLLGWGLPLIPTLLSAALAPHSYTPTNSDICYPKDNALYFGLVLPIGLVVAINMIIYIIVIWSIFRNASVRKSVTKYDMDQLRVTLVLFFLLGLTWTFGLLSQIHSSMQITFSYIFNLTAPLQGFIIFVYAILLNPETRSLWLREFNNSYKSSSE